MTFGADLPLEQHANGAALLREHERRLTHDPIVERLDDDPRPGCQFDQRLLCAARIAAEIRRQVGFEATGGDGNSAAPVKPLRTKARDGLAQAGEVLCGRPPLCPAPTDSVDAGITASGRVLGPVQMWTLRVHFVPADARPCPSQREKP